MLTTTLIMMMIYDGDGAVAVLVPHSNLYIVVSPVCAMVDYLTIEWLNEFLLDLAKRAVSPATNNCFIFSRRHSSAVM